MKYTIEHPDGRIVAEAYGYENMRCAIRTLRDEDGEIGDLVVTVCEAPVAWSCNRPGGYTFEVLQGVELT